LLEDIYLDHKASSKPESKAFWPKKFTYLHIDKEKQTNSKEESDADSDEWALAVLHEIIIQLYIQKLKNNKECILYMKPKCLKMFIPWQ